MIKLNHNYYSSVFSTQVETIDPETIVENHGSVSVTELMVRFAQGVPLGVSDNGLVFESSKDPNLTVDDKPLGIHDLTDLQQHMQTISLARQHATADYKRIKAEKAAEKARKSQEEPPKPKPNEDS